MDFTFYPIILFVAVWLLFAAVAATVLIRNRSKYQTSRYHPARKKYHAGEFSPQMELDLRLPYRRFKQLYPNSALNYETYKNCRCSVLFDDL